MTEWLSDINKNKTNIKAVKKCVSFVQRVNQCGAYHTTSFNNKTGPHYSFAGQKVNLPEYGTSTNNMCAVRSTFNRYQLHCVYCVSRALLGATSLCYCWCLLCRLPYTNKLLIILLCFVWCRIHSPEILSVLINFFIAYSYETSWFRLKIVPKNSLCNLNVRNYCRSACKYRKLSLLILRVVQTADFFCYKEFFVLLECNKKCIELSGEVLKFVKLIDTKTFNNRKRLFK